MARQQIAVAGFLILALILGSGCGGQRPIVLPGPQPDVERLDESEVVTLQLNPRDYNDVAERLATSILTDPDLPLDRSRTLSLGPVDTEHCVYAFDTRTFQEKLQTILLRSRKINVNYAVDALKENSAAGARYNVMLLQWEKESTVSPEDLRTFGSLARVDYLLFGRLSAQTTEKMGWTEVTYTFNWKLGDCESGLLVWADEMEITKRK